MLADRRVKIVGTIGPATSSKENLKHAITSGLNVARLNFSHGQHEDHLAVIKNIRELILELKAPVAILQDLQGPKIRVGQFEQGQIELVKDDVVVITTEETLGKSGLIPTDFKKLPQACKVGDKILFDDGLMDVTVIEVSSTTLKAKVNFGGILKNRKGMNVPGVMLPVDCMTKKDIEDLKFGLSQQVDFVALSFVRQGSDIIKLREIIQQHSPSTQIIAKIEMMEAIENLEDIIQLSDGVMVARGDLAVEVGQTRLPAIQKRIINLANQFNKPVITATQMLDSMIQNPRPTRAEITDVANAVMDGSDALMLSAETASGKYPFRCIETMDEIIREVEKDPSFYYDLNLDQEEMDVAESIGASACLTTLKLKASAIVCLSTTGRTAKVISGYRPQARIIAITHLLHTLNRLELVWGVQTYSINAYKSTDDAMSQVEDLLLRYGLVKAGDRVVLTLGVPVVEKSKTNSLRVYTIGDRFVEKEPNDRLPLRCRD
ncbi:MAG: pyruvate kinase [Bdellovibrionales bacterium]|nr:pyruvate kinase [Bdellovibrionales bacterium]